MCKGYNGHAAPRVQLWGRIWIRTKLQLHSGRGRLPGRQLPRVYLEDDDGQRAVFDLSIDSDGGYVTDTWVHVVLGCA